MGKRKGGHSGDGGKKKKFKATGFVDPNTSGVYATCNRGREQQCRKELMNLFSEKIEEYFDLDKEVSDDDEEDEEEKEEVKELSIEDQIKQELNDMKEEKKSKKSLLHPIELGCECLIFIKTRRTIDPEILVSRICQESFESNIKTTRYTQKLSPVTFSVSPTIEEIKKLAKRVLAKHFHQPTDIQKPLKFAIQIGKRNFNAIPKDTIIKAVAESVGRDHGHKVDLKQYDKLIMVECYKTNVGMSVVDNYLKYEKFNLQQIFEKNLSDDTSSSRVKDTNGNSKVINKQDDKSQSDNKDKSEDNKQQDTEN
ncbi:thump domain-containing protein [Scheffersomyces coipomensis]|uniref:thump domain-containing protein n=1 Tax=Scheffersomyces coipomensis TaxID=1788519 RepID=UPI00315D7C5D